MLNLNTIYKSHTAPCWVKSEQNLQALCVLSGDN